MAETVNIAQFAFTSEYFLRPLARHAKRAREGAEELDDLGDVVVIFAIFGAGLRIEEIIACYQFENLGKALNECCANW